MLAERDMILAYDSDFFGLLVSSYRRTVGAEPAFFEPGPPGQRPSAAWLYDEGRHPVLAHNTDPDPRFIYANKAAQACFEYGWDEIVSLPSRLSAEPVDREERQKLLDDVARQGFATGYSGLRIAKSGRRFWIEDGVVWQLIDEDGAVRGQAATFAKWRDA
jgi:PAS domain-containing protein